MDTTKSDSAACGKCGSHRLMHQVRMESPDAAAAYWLSARLSRRGFLGISSAIRGETTATICAECGYTELFTDNLTELWEAYSEENR